MASEQLLNALVALGGQIPPGADALPDGAILAMINELKAINPPGVDHEARDEKNKDFVNRKKSFLAITLAKNAEAKTAAEAASAAPAIVPPPVDHPNAPVIDNTFNALDHLPSVDSVLPPLYAPAATTIAAVKDASNNVIPGNVQQAIQNVSIEDIINRLIKPEKTITAPVVAPKVIDNKIIEDPMAPAGSTVTETGTFGEGNIDLKKRPVALLPEGSKEAIYTTSFEEDGKQVLSPLISPSGKLMTQEQALAEYKRTGKSLGRFDNSEDATKYATAVETYQKMLFEHKLPTAFPAGPADMEKYTPETLADRPFPGMLSDDELIAQLAKDPYNPEYRKEVDFRNQNDKGDFFTNLVDPNFQKWQTDRMARHVSSGTAQLFDFAESGAGLGSLAIAPVEFATGWKLGSKELREFAAARADLHNDLSGSGAPRDFIESMGQIAPALLPIPGPKILSSAGHLIEAITPFVVGPTKSKLATNALVAATLDQSIHQLTQGPNTPYKTIFDAVGVDRFDETQEGGINPTALAVLAAIPLAAMILPATANLLNKQKTIIPLTISDMHREGKAPLDLATFETAGDVNYAHVFDSEAVLNRFIDRAQLPDPTSLKAALEITTQAEVRNNIQNAIHTGLMPTTFSTYKAPIAPKLFKDTFSHFDEMKQKEFVEYLNQGNYADILKQQIREKKVPASVGNGPTRLKALRASRKAFEAKYPDLKAWDMHYKGIMDAVISHTTKGPYALIDKATYQAHSIDQPNIVFHGANTRNTVAMPSLIDRMVTAGDESKRTETFKNMLERDVTDIVGTNGLAHPLDTMMAATESILAAQARNDFKGQYVDQMLQSPVRDAKGNPTIRLATAEEVEKFPTRIVTIKRAGKTEHYITSKLQALTLRMDPYVLKHPGYMLAYAPKRALELGTTAVFGAYFNTTQMLRDVMTGYTNNTAGIKGPSLVGTAIAPLKIMSYKALQAFHASAEAKLGAGLKSVFPGINEQTSRKLVALSAQAMQNTAFSALNSGALYEGSVLRTRIEQSYGALDELMLTIKENTPNVVSKWAGRPLVHVANGVNVAFNAFLEAARLSATERNLKAGMSVADAGRAGRRMTGDNTRSGRFMLNDGTILDGDVVNRLTNLALKPMGAAVAGARISIPYTNPAIKGSERMWEAATTDPVEWARRNWVAASLPAMLAVAWNDMCTQDSNGAYDYNAYATEQRSVSDQTMNLYLCVPGKPPEAGWEYPTAHENVLFTAPFVTALNEMRKSTPEIQEALKQTLISVADNSRLDSFPTAGSLLFNMAGYDAPDKVLANWADTSYPIKEDHSGIMPQNLEQALKTVSGSFGQMALDTAYAFLSQKDVERKFPDAVEAMLLNIAKKNVFTKGEYNTPVVMFTPINMVSRKKLEAYKKFNDEWTLHIKRSGMIAGKVPSGESLADPTTGDGINIDISRMPVTAPPTPYPLNPIYEEYGTRIHDVMETNEQGLPNIQSRLGILKEDVKFLQGWSPGKRDEYQSYYEGLTEKTGDPVADAEKAKVKYLLDSNGLKLTNYKDVTKLISLLENENYATMQQQLVVIQKLEQEITDDLVTKGVFKPGQKFTFENNLDPMHFQ